MVSGATMLIEILYREGVEVVFGYPGGAVLNIYDELYKQKYFRHILTRHEQGAVHAADGYARASGKVGVAILTSGPGFTNAITGIATAYTDSIPLIIITGQVPLPQIGTDAFQEIDALGISRPCTKHNYLIKSVKDVAKIFKEAFYIARSGRPGPVLIDFPKDISANKGEFIYPDDISIQTYKPSVKGNVRQIKRLTDAIEAAKKPLFYIGGGAVISNAFNEIRELINKTNIPAVETLMARGVCGDDNPHFLGMAGMHGTYASNMAISECDLLISLGARFDDRITGKLSEFAKHAKIAHIDVDPTSIGKVLKVSYPIVGDLKSVCADLITELGEYSNDHSEWLSHLNTYKISHPLRYKDSDSEIKPQWVIEYVGKTLGDRAIISTDVGQHQMWAAQFYPFSFPRQLITSGGLGTMGFGLPASMGVKLAKPKKISVNISGDGSILMNIQELMTACEENLPSINIVLNNNSLGMVRQWQSFFYCRRHSCSNLHLQPDFVMLARSFGGEGFRVTTKEEFKQALDEAVKLSTVSIIDVVIPCEEVVLPMVPAGGAIYEMIELED